jgi:hypothetical protein
MYRKENHMAHEQTVTGLTSSDTDVGADETNPLSLVRAVQSLMATNPLNIKSTLSRWSANLRTNAAGSFYIEGHTVFRSKLAVEDCSKNRDAFTKSEAFMKIFNYAYGRNIFSTVLANVPGDRAISVVIDKSYTNIDKNLLSAQLSAVILNIRDIIPTPRDPSGTLATNCHENFKKYNLTEYPFTQQTAAAAIQHAPSASTTGVAVVPWDFREASALVTTTDQPPAHRMPLPTTRPQWAAATENDPLPQEGSSRKRPAEEEEEEEEMRRSVKARTGTHSHPPLAVSAAATTPRNGIAALIAAVQALEHPTGPLHNASAQAAAPPPQILI